MFSVASQWNQRRLRDSNQNIFPCLALSETFLQLAWNFSETCLKLFLISKMQDYAYQPIGWIFHLKRQWKTLKYFKHCGHTWICMKHCSLISEVKTSKLHLPRRRKTQLKNLENYSATRYSPIPLKQCTMITRVVLRTEVAKLGEILDVFIIFVIMAEEGILS